MEHPVLLPDAVVPLVEEWLDRLLPAADTPPKALHRAMRYAVFSGGKRLRPRLLLHVAHACGIHQEESELAWRAACAVELIHSASLVHDDLPCFDDATSRRNHPTVHVRFGEPMAVLAGDALLSSAFELLATSPRHLAHRALHLVHLMGRATGSFGLIGGQSLEQENPDHTLAAVPCFSPEFIERYHAMKTGALFRIAAEAGAAVAGAADVAAWSAVGQRVGAWYQLADDVIDVRGQAHTAGKPVARDAVLGRPNAVLSSGEAAVRAQIQALFDEIRARVCVLAVAPEPLFAFLDALSSVTSLGAAKHAEHVESSYGEKVSSPW